MIWKTMCRQPIAALAAVVISLASQEGVVAANSLGRFGNSPSVDIAIAQVSSDRVCMVTNRVFDAPQIPVKVDGRTYYGCCAMCKERLASDASLRSAVDPVTGRSIDKSSAVIGALPSGNVVYFESQKSLEAFSGSARG